MFPSKTATPSIGPRLSPAEVESVHVAVRQLTGLHFDDWRIETLERAVVARIAATGTASFSRYLALLQDRTERSRELTELINQITVHETCFFRYPAQFDFLRDYALPDLVQRRPHRQRPVRIWSAGCSTGEEPYSIAISALEAFGAASADLVNIFATDVSSRTLEAARLAEYSAKSLRLLDGARRDQFFRPIADDRFALCEPVRRMVTFQLSNLVDDAGRGLAAWDIIFCRNILIYFDANRTAQVIAFFSRCLSPDGYLFTGHSEILDRSVFVPCEARDAFVYRKTPSERGEHSKPVQAPSAHTIPTVEPRRVGIAHQARHAAAGSAPPTPATTDADRCEKMFQQALTAFDREDFAQACSHLDPLLEQFPRYLPARLLRANLFLIRGDSSQSMEECRLALQLAPLCYEAYLLLGMNFQQLSNFELAVEHLKKAAYLRPDACLVQYRLGEAYRASQQPEEARRAFQNTLTLLPSASDREVLTYCGGFGKRTLQTLCEQMIATCD